MPRCQEPVRLGQVAQGLAEEHVPPHVRTRRGGRRVARPQREAPAHGSRGGDDAGLRTESDAESEFLFPWLRSTNPAKYITKKIHEFAPGGKHHANYRGPPINQSHSAGSFRVGAITRMLPRLCENHAISISGHAPGDAFCNIRIYFDQYLVDAIPGARVLAMHRPPPHGQLCGPPPTPSLVPSPHLPDWQGQIEAAMKKLFSINNSSHPKLRPGASLWPLLETCFASLLYHYNDIVKEKVLLQQVVQLQDAMRHAKLAAVGMEHAVLDLMSQQIRAKYDVDLAADSLRVSAQAIPGQHELHQQV